MGIGAQTSEGRDVVVGERGLPSRIGRVEFEGLDLLCEL